ncbi:MAG TPA: signal peptidase I, partial [Sphingomicrobium sp.]
MASRSSRRGARKSNSAQGDKETAGSLMRFILSVAVLAWLFRSFIVQPFYIPSGSMLPSLYVGDYLIVEKWPYGYSRYSFPFGMPAFGGKLLSGMPQRGDVAVFRHPVENSDLIKRVIGLPGDLVEVRGGRLVLNGRPVQRRPLPAIKVPMSPNTPCRVVPPAEPTVTEANGHSACVYPAFLETLPGGPSYTVLDQLRSGPADDFPATRVPAGHVFLMGDNRDDSLDSRFPTVEGGVG